MQDKITNKVALTKAIEVLNDCSFEDKEDVLEKLGKILDRETKKSTTKSPKQIAKDNANLNLMNDIVAYLSDGNARTATEVYNGVTGVTSTPKASYLLSELIKGGKVTRNVVKGTPYYSLV